MSYADNGCDARFITTLHSDGEIKIFHQIPTLYIRYYIVEGSMTYNLYMRCATDDFLYCHRSCISSQRIQYSIHTHNWHIAVYDFGVHPKEKLFDLRIYKYLLCVVDMKPCVWRRFFFRFEEYNYSVEEAVEVKAKRKRIQIDGDE